MPAPTQQTAAGPSASSSSLTTSQTHANSKKRSGSEVVDDSARDVKKVKLEGEALSLSVNIKEKDKKKKKKKKKRRTSVVAEVSQVQPRKREASKPRSNAMAPPLSDTRTTPELKNGHVEVEVADTRTLKSSNKGKGKARSPSPAQRVATPPTQPIQPVASGSGASNGISDQMLEIAKLKAELAAKTTLLGRHQSHFTQHQQSLTCQICLDLMHKPYALAPCGHMTCYGCLVRWFTANPNPDAAANPGEPENDSIEGILNGATAMNGAFIRRRKNCPVCRAVVTERPIEMWGIKSMVVSLVKSGLSDFPNPPPQEDNGANCDPWKNVFRKAGALNARHFGHMGFHGYFAPHVHPPPPAGDEDRNEMGWYDAEDGGIYRCIDCYHEIVYGRCTHCARVYPGHEGHDEDDDDEDGSDFDGHPHPRHLPGLQRFMDALMDGTHEGMDDESVDDDMIFPDEDALYGALHGDDDDDDDSLDGGDIPPYYDLIPPPVEGVGYTDESDESDGEDHDMPYIVNRNQRRRNAERRRLALATAAALHVGEEDDDEEASDYEGSFIDDGIDLEARHSDEDIHAVDEDDSEEEDEVERRVHRNPPPRRRRAAPIISSDDEVEVIEDPRILARRLGRSSRAGVRRSGGPSRPIVLEDEEDEDEGEEEEVLHDDEGSDLGSGSRSPHVHYSPTFDLEDDNGDEEDF